MSHREPIKLIVIHGWGGTFARAVDTVTGLLHFPACWKQGAFHVERRMGLVLRELLAAPDPDVDTQALQKLIVSRLLLSSSRVCKGPQAIDSRESIRLTEQRILSDMGHLGIPISPAAREERARQLREEAYSRLGPMLSALDELKQPLSPRGATAPCESEAREVIREAAAGRAWEGNLLSLLETIRGMHETGGDMDTIGSAVLYTHYLAGRAARDRRPFRLGSEYRYVFLNYHESLRPLSALGPAELYMADLPLGAFPDFADDARYLRDHDVFIKRFEDHHPYTGTIRRSMEKLRDDGALEFFDLSGPCDGEEPDILKCGTDMVFDNTIAGTDRDCPGARTIRDAAHAEDYVTDRSALSRLLTDLIKGNACKVELAQILFESIRNDDAYDRLRDRGWDKLPRAWYEVYREQEESLLENAYLLSFRRPEGAGPVQGAQALGPGSDTPEWKHATGRDRDSVRVLVALAPFVEPGTRRITTGKAIEYYSRTIPEADYVFYCYGCSIMLARRVNQADFSFNLGVMMPLIGSSEDGGHSGAAVCRPDTSPQYPTRLLRRVTPSNFRSFARYLSVRLTRMGNTFQFMENRSLPPAREQLRRGGTKLLYVTLAAAVLGLVLVLLHPAFRPSSIMRSNIGFFPQIAPEEGAPDGKDALE